jgi:hypothetical protein
MAAALTECIQEQRSVIRFLWSEAVETGDVYERMTFQYGGNCMNQKEGYELVERYN